MIFNEYCKLIQKGEPDLNLTPLAIAFVAELEVEIALDELCANTFGLSWRIFPCTSPIIKFLGLNSLMALTFKYSRKV